MLKLITNKALHNNNYIIGNPSITSILANQSCPLIQTQRSFTSIKEKIKKERMERLKQESAYFPIKSFDDMNFIRNFGIIAHIDAGKTTTTERMLYYAGALSEPGEVHDGNTVMDYMPQERDRGITIRAAAITFSWNKHQFNLIDTPGHIDFTGEVERSLRVLDGAVAIFDGVNGVQTQSESVWLQANKFDIPRLAFVNKMDRSGADLEYCLESMKRKLNINPIVIQMPIMNDDILQGVVDLINMKKIDWIDQLGDTVQITDLQEGTSLHEKAKTYRERMLETMALFDDQIAEEFLNGAEFTSSKIESAIKAILNKNPKKTCAVLVGSALKNKGVQPIMDAVIKYLPAPNEKGPVKAKNLLTNREVLRHPDKKSQLCALAFKVLNDAEKGPLVYCRIYSGVLANKTHLFNSSQNFIEKPNQIYRVRANKYVNVPELATGDIAAISGMKVTSSGDTIIEAKDTEKVVLKGLVMPPPVFTCSLEYESLKDKPLLEQAWKNMMREDTSLIVKEDEETGQILVSGLGELHLEVFRDRLESEYNLRTRLGAMKVSYRESIQDSVTLDLKYTKPFNGRPTYAYLEIMLEVLQPEDRPAENENINASTKFMKGENMIVFGFDKENDTDFMRFYNEYKRRHQTKSSATRFGEKKKEINIDEEEPDELPQGKDQKKPEDVDPLRTMKYIRNNTEPTELESYEDEFGEDILYSMASIPFDMLYGIETAIDNALSSGQLLGYPMINAKVTILNGNYSEKRSTTTIFEMCCAQLIRDATEKANPVILEPVMEVEISTPSSLAPSIMNDIIGTRRGRINEIKEETSKFGEHESSRKTILSIIPLSETVGYSTYLRSITKGEASFVMVFKQYEPLNPVKQKELLSGLMF